jgi:hypothetical protein
MYILSEADIQQVMADTGMEYLQARRHLKCRMILQDSARSAHAARIRSLIDRAVDAASLTVSSMNSVPHVASPPN